MDEWEKDHRKLDNQLEAIKKIEDLFLTRKIVSIYSTNEERDLLNKERLLQSKYQFFELKEIIKKYELDSDFFLLRLIEALQLKAENIISALTVLPQTINPDLLEKFGVDRELIEGTKRVHDFFYKKAKTPYLEGNKRGGSKRSEHQQKNYEEHKEYWDAWQKNPDMYSGVTAYDEAMRKKTRAAFSTIRNHREEFKNNAQSKPTDK
jgi:hypothetical protein